MAISQEIKDRIYAAADELLAESLTGEFPKLEAVRQRSRAGMNNVVEAMKEWRARQRKQVQAVREPLPVDLLAEVQNMGQGFWETAQRLANESLDTAKAAFEAEKNDLTEISIQQSEAFETQAVELATAQDRIVELDRVVEASTVAAQASTRQLDEIRAALLAAEQRAAIAEQKAEEIEHRAADLRAELTHAHGEAERLRIELDKAQERADAAGVLAEKADTRTEQLRELFASQTAKADATIAQLRDMLAAQTDKAGTTIEQLRESLAAQTEKAGGTIEQLRMELTTTRVKAEAAEQQYADQRKRTAEEVQRTAERMSKAESERDQVLTAASAAREDAAGLRGQLEATKTQNEAMLIALKPAAAIEESGKPAPQPKRGGKS